MNDENQEKNPEQEHIVAHSKSVQEQKLSAMKRFNIASLIAIIFTGFSIILLILFYFKFSQDIQKQRQSTEKILMNQQALEKNLITMKQSIFNVESKLIAYEQTLAQLKVKQDDMLHNQVSPIKLTQLMEIKQLLQQAQLLIQFDKNASDAAKVLQLVQQQLSDIDASVFTNVQKQLAKDLLELKSQPKLDRVILLARIHSIDARIKRLPVMATTFHAQIVQPNYKLNDESWKAKLAQTLDKFKSLIVIRYRSQPFEPFLPPAQQAALQQTLTQLLNQTSWSVLHHDEPVYRWSLLMTLDLLNHYYPENTSELVAIKNEINNLSELDIALALPDLSPLLIQYQIAFEQWNQQNMVNLK